MPEIVRIGFQIPSGTVFGAINPNNLRINPASFRDVGLDDLPGASFQSLHVVSLPDCPHSCAPVFRRTVQELDIFPPPTVRSCHAFAIIDGLREMMDVMRDTRDTTGVDKLVVRDLQIVLELSRQREVA
jgi:hypothetical protein